MEGGKILFTTVQFAHKVSVVRKQSRKSTLISILLEYIYIFE